MRVSGSCATVVQCDNSTVRQGYRSTVLQDDSGTMVQYYKATVLQGDSVTVRQCDSTTNYRNPYLCQLSKVKWLVLLKKGNV